ncbi:MAG: biotin transporter BioY [Candidatus Omnitrophica bacterium]|jgi:biotin transport system substrate-specific component|nr:biotin transporter BioY [Candidatus Omnitrophota bacterium]
MQALLKKDFALDKATAGYLAMFLFTVMTVLSGFIRIPIPMSPVPVTLQTFFVILAGASLSGYKGGISQILYLALGVMGAPVFSTQGSAFLYITGPSGGYMAGFVLAALFLGFMPASFKKSYVRIFLTFLAADAVILATGAVWLGALTGYDPVRIFQIGVLPFVPGDIFKAFAAAAVYKAIKPRLDRVLY